MFLFFGGIIFALFGVLGCADLVQKKKKCTEETTAIVTEISKEIDNDNNLSYWPIIEYNINGKKFAIFSLRVIFIFLFNFSFFFSIKLFKLFSFLDLK